MNNLSHKILFFTGLIIIFGQQNVFADNRQHSHRNKPYSHWNKAPAPHRSRNDYQFERRYVAPIPSYRSNYKPGYRVNPLPRGYSRVFVNAAEYYFFDGYFYRPSRSGYVIVESPIGAIIANIPRLHHIIYWHGEPYYAVGNTFYRRHPRGYLVVPDPGYVYRH